jgi:serine/threonine protein kinase
MIGQLLTERYLVVKKLGSGGFSETYLARDKFLPKHPLCVVKRLKLSSSSTISQDTAQRLFETEARILDQMGQQHAQIPTLFAYCHQQDQIYQVQEYIDGDNLGSWLARRRRLSPQGAIELLVDVLPVLSFIHAHHVIHRDIKPSHLIQRRSDGKVVLIDFGAALSMPESNVQLDRVELDEEALLAIGTLGYMPDEQQAGQACYSSDLYALGLSVVELMTGTPPTQLLYDSIMGELDWQAHLYDEIDCKLAAILDRMVRCDVRDRYQQADDVLTALEALPPDVYPRRKSKGWSVSFWQRYAHRAAVQVGQQVIKPAVALTLLTSLLAGWYFHDRTLPVGTMLAQFGNFPHRSDLSLTLLRDLPVQAAIDQMLIAPNNQVLVTASADHVLRLWSLPNGSMLKSLSGHADTVTALSMSQDSRLLVSGSEDHTVRLWDVASGKLLREFQGNREAVTAIAISPDARTVVSGSRDGTLRLWNLQTGALLRTLVVPETEVTAVTYGGRLDQLVSATSIRGSTASGTRQIQVWNLGSGQLRRTFAGHTAPIVGLQAVDDHTLLSFGKDRVLLWDLQREELVRVFSEDSAQPVAAFLNDQQMMSVYDNGNIQIWARNTGWRETTLSGKWRNLEAALSPNHSYLVCWSADQRLRVWQLADRQ